MGETWFDRLDSAVKRDGRSLRAISLAAKCGPNFLQQMMRDRKEPGVDRLLAILNTLGTASTLYVLTGKVFSRDDEEFLRLVLSIDPALRAEAMSFFRALQAHEGTPRPLPSDAG